MSELFPARPAHIIPAQTSLDTVPVPSRALGSSFPSSTVTESCYISLII